MLVVTLFSLPCTLSVVLVLFSAASFALHNVTVDDNDPSVSYAGNWVDSPPSNTFNVGGTHHYSTDPHATAVFTFTVYYLAPRWTYKVGAAISLNGGEDTFVNLQDTSGNKSSGSEISSSVVSWSRTGLDGGEQRIMIKFPTGQADYVVVDAFIVTAQDPSDKASPSPNTTISGFSDGSTPLPTHSESSSSNSFKNPGAIAGIVIGAVAIILLVIGIFLVRRKMKHGDSRYAFPFGTGAFGRRRASTHIVSPYGSGTVGADGADSLPEYYGVETTSVGYYHPGIGQTVSTLNASQTSLCSSSWGSRSSVSGQSSTVADSKRRWDRKNTGNVIIRTDRDTGLDHPPAYTG